MTHQLIHLAAVIVSANRLFVGFEGLLFGTLLFTSLLIFMRRRARKEAA